MPRLKSQIDPVTPEARAAERRRRQRASTRTQAQNTAYWGLVNRLGLDETTRRAQIYERYGKASSKWLTKPQMADLINWLKYLAGEAREYVPAVTAGGASVAQVKFIERLEGALGWENPDRLAGFLDAQFGKATPEDLTSREASRTIEALKSMGKR